MFKLGFFVLLGFVLLAASLIWVGNRDGGGDAQNYVSYFRDSVQGLQTGSPVKYQGIDVGKVVDISVAPDPYLIQIIYSVRGDDSLVKMVMAGIAFTGITGMAYIELVPQDTAAVEQSPRVDFNTPYPLIPSYARGIQKVMTSVGTIMDKLSAVDFEGLSKRLDSLLASIQKIADNQEMQMTISHLYATSKNLETFSAELARLSKSGEGAGVADLIVKAGQDIREVSRNIKEQIEKMELEQLSRKVNLYVDDLGGALLRLGQNLEMASERLSRLSGRLENAPSDIIFSQPPPPLPQEGVK
jgi:phospholipid/cholesterol/gamma-HCH transport system substrate-binding protein